MPYDVHSRREQSVCMPFVVATAIYTGRERKKIYIRERLPGGGAKFDVSTKINANISSRKGDEGGTTNRPTFYLPGRSIFRTRHPLRRPRRNGGYGCRTAHWVSLPPRGRRGAPFPWRVVWVHFARRRAPGNGRMVVVGGGEVERDGGSVARTIEPANIIRTR